MEPVNKKIILIAVVLATFTTILIYFYITKATNKPGSIDYTDVYVAAKTLPAKYKMTDSDIKRIKISKELLNKKAILNKNDIVGKWLKDSVIEGEQILRDRLLNETKTTLSYIVPKGKRAVSINVVEQIAAAYLLRPGDFVDVIASFDKEEVESQNTKTVFPRVTKTIIQNVEILAIGQEQTIDNEKLKEIPKTITLAVNPTDAERLVYASEYGILRLAMRPIDDSNIINTPGIIREDITSGKGVYTVPK